MFVVILGLVLKYGFNAIVVQHDLQACIYLNYFCSGVAFNYIFVGFVTTNNNYKGLELYP